MKIAYGKKTPPRLHLDKVIAGLLEQICQIAGLDSAKLTVYVRQEVGTHSHPGSGVKIPPFDLKDTPPHQLPVLLWYIKGSHQYVGATLTYFGTDGLLETSQLLQILTLAFDGRQWEFDERKKVVRREVIGVNAQLNGTFPLDCGLTDLLDRSLDPVKTHSSDCNCEGADSEPLNHPAEPAQATTEILSGGTMQNFSSNPKGIQSLLLAIAVCERPNSFSFPDFQSFLRDSFTQGLKTGQYLVLMKCLIRWGFFEKLPQKDGQKSASYSLTNKGQDFASLPSTQIDDAWVEILESVSRRNPKKLKVSPVSDRYDAQNEEAAAKAHLSQLTADYYGHLIMLKQKERLLKLMEQVENDIRASEQGYNEYLELFPEGAIC
jgi:hypothetical protein